MIFKLSCKTIIKYKKKFQKNKHKLLYKISK